MLIKSVGETSLRRKETIEYKERGVGGSGDVNRNSYIS